MASWKKVIVSGSSAELSNLVVDNDVSASLFSGSFFGDGSGLTGVAGNFPSTPLLGTSHDATQFFVSDGASKFLSGSQLAAYTFGKTSGDVVINSTGTATIQANSVALATDTTGDFVATITGGDGIDSTGATTGENISHTLSVDATVLRTTGGGIISSSAQVDHDQTTNFDANEHFTQANITTVGTVTSGDVSAILPTGTLSGSSQITLGGDLSGTANSATVEAVQGVALTSGEATQLANINSVTITNTQWGYLGNLDQGVATSNSPQFTNLTVTGDLVVQGTTTELQVTNLNVEDQYILLNSGSTTGDTGIIFGGANGTANTGTALIWDFSYNGNDGRLGIVNTLAADATGTQTPNYVIAGVFEGTEANAATAQADHNGNIRIEGEDIFIYS